eukprot:scaffold7064_cov111-Cylindrotheca_fusiformis.AAC.10
MLPNLQEWMPAPKYAAVPNPASIKPGRWENLLSNPPDIKTVKTKRPTCYPYLATRAILRPLNRTVGGAKINSRVLSQKLNAIQRSSIASAQNVTR